MFVQSTEDRESLQIQNRDLEADPNPLVDSHDRKSANHDDARSEEADQEERKGYDSVTQHVIKVFDRKNKQIQKEVIYFNEQETPLQVDDDERLLNNSADDTLAPG